MNKILFKILFIIFFSIYYTFLCFAQNYETEIIKDLHQNPKINHPEEVLKDYIEGKQRIRVVVKLSKGIIIQQDTNFKDISSRKKLKEAVKRVQDSVINCLGPDNIRITNRFSYIYAFGAEVNLRGLKQLTEINNVISIRIAMVLRPNLAQGIPLMSAWTVRSQYNGENIAIAVCDSGIDYTHPMLGGGRFPNSKVIGGYDFVDRDADPIDTDGHGTACAGIAAGDIGYQGDYIGGVAYNAKLYALRVSNFSDLIESWEWCIDHKNDDPLNPIMIISTSLSAGYFTSVCDSDSDFAQTAANVHAAGIALFASSGNEGYCDGIACPACISDVISVGAVYDAEWGTRDDVADFRGGVRHSISQESCIGKYEPNYWREDSWACEDESTSADIVLCSSNTATFLDILAPGTDAYTTGLADGFVENFGGTSAACAYAAGAAACLQSAAKSITGSFLSPDEVRALLTSTGDLITDTKEEHIGITKPRINLRNAINAISGDDLPLGYAVDNMSLTWTTGGDADWFGQTDENRFDGDAAHSAYGQNSWIETTVTGPGVLSFYWEATEFDRLKLYIDGMKQAESNLWRSSRWVGVIESGSHILRWISTDAGWLDKVFFEAIIPLDEALDTTDLVWKTGGDADWFGHGCGIYYDGDVAHSAYGQSSWIETTVTGPGVLSFYWKVLGSASYIRFYIDDVEHTKTNSINWRQRVLGIPSGSHTLKWSHDSITGAGCLDRVKFTTDNPSLDKALDNKYLEWRTGGDVGWFGQTKITFDNEGAAQSGTIMDKSQNSWIETMVTGPGILSFYEKVTGNYSDQLVFSIDGNSVDVFQGLSDWYWKKKAYSISPGTHTLILNFTTDSGSGTAWMDRVGFTAAPAIVLTSPIGEGPFKHRSLVSIKWVNSEDVSSNIRIELYKGGSLHHTITTNTENDGYYEWCVPTTLPVGKDYRIKVSSISDPSIYAASDNDFIIEETFSSSLGGYLILEGTDDFLEALDHPELNLGDGPGESFTIEAWYYAPGIYGFGSIIEKPNSYFLRFGREWDIFTLKVRSSIIYHLEGVTGGIHCRWPPHPTGWHHVALVGGNGWVRLFFDGEILTEREYSGSLKNSTENLRIGEGVGRAFDEIRISDVARYNEAPFIPPTSPFECDIHTLALWRFEETGGATRFHDACGEDNTLYMGNTAPVSSDDSVSLDEDSILSGALSASDANGDSLTYCIVTNGALGTVTITDVTTGTFTYRPDENANGSDCFTFKVNDGLEDSNIATVMVTINPINDAPTISGTPQTAVEEDMPYSFTPSVNDPDVGDTLSFSIENKPGWASFSTTIGALSGTPGNDDIGTIPGIVITVIDANGASNSLPPFDLTVVKVDTDLEIRMTVDNLTHSVDATIIFTITVTNNSPRDTTGVQVIDILPLGLRYVSDDSEGSYDKDTGKWNIGNLSATAPNNTVSLNITATVIHQGEIVNIASITDSEVTDSDITNNSFGLILNGGSQADLAIEKTVNNPVPIAGDTVTFTIIVTNNGVDDTTRMQVTDVLPTGLTYRSNTPFQGTYDSNTGIWDVGNLNEGDSATLQLTATVNNENELISTARISRSDQIDPDTTNNESSVIINQDTINHPFIADLSIQKIVNQRVINVEDEVVFTLLVRNNGPDDANNVKINDLLPDGLTYISSEPSQGVYLEETGIWEIGTISAASYVIMDIVVKVIDAALQTNIAAISNLNEVDTYTGNDSDEVTVRRLQADISVKKSVDDQNPIIGNNIVFTITVENKGPDDATGIQIIDLLPAGLKYLDDNSGGSYDSGTGVWDIAGLANGASASLQINTRVDQLGEITTSVTRTASSPMDPDTGNDSESIIVIVTDDDIDSDGDGLSDSLERTICTDPNDSDTDGDGIPDGVENVNNNGIVDAGETSPCNSDTDSDGMPDGWEVQYGLEPLINDANDDLDKDFVSNLKEYLSGTEPNNPDSIPNRAPTVPMINDPPSIPMIKNPGDNTEVCTLRPTLSINPSTDINGDQITYDFELYSDEALSDLIISISGIECLWSINVNLINYADYYWRARAIDEHGLSSQWSSVATFKVNSLEITIEIYASQDVFASATNLQTIEVKASDCPIKGASIEIPPGALTEYITITIGEATNGPPLPTGTMAIGRIIDLGPKGITFTIPVSIRIPYTDEDLEKAGVSDPSELEVFTYNTPALSWESVDIDNIDSQNNLLICKVDHFSLYSMGISELPDDGHGGSEGNGSNGNGCFIGIALYGANGTTDFLKKNKQNSERSDMRENMLKNVKNFITVFF